MLFLAALQPSGGQQGASGKADDQAEGEVDSAHERTAFANSYSLPNTSFMRGIAFFVEA